MRPVERCRSAAEYSGALRPRPARGAHRAPLLTRRREARRCAGPSPPRASRRRRRPASDELDRVAVPERPVERLDLRDGVAEGAQDIGHPEPEARLEPDLDREREVLLRLDEPARRADRGRDVHPAVDQRATPPGRGSAAGRRRPSSRPRPTAGRPGTASRAAACGASACPARGRWDGPASRLKNEPRFW